jgi:hypothetical protein
MVIVLLIGVIPYENALKIGRRAGKVMDTAALQVLCKAGMATCGGTINRAFI